jgi:sphingomyelin phosphodiesterase acid-like 3
LRSVRKRTGLRFMPQVVFWLLVFAAFPLAGRGQAQPSSHAVVADRTIPALLVSDIHFDPLHDPAKIKQLANAPVSQWSSILSSAPSPNQQQAFAQLQQTCHARGVDTPYDLLRSSLQAMRSQLPEAQFITVSGDLLVHSFDCRYKTLLPASKPDDYQAFVLKTLSFVMGELRATFPVIPIYVALGNNDTPCGDYRLDTGSNFLLRTGRIVAEGLPPSQRREALKAFATGGYYSVTMAAPMRDTRLIVVNDVFLSPNYSTCSGKADPAAATAQMAWLQDQLAQAQRLGQRVWVMGHIPPGVDPYSTVARFKNVCAGEAPAMFLSSDKLADLLVEHAGVIRLGIFAHTHMDELRLLEAHGSGQGVALKLVPSISPVDGNNPSFTVARVGRDSATLQDYAVIAASNRSGIGTTWSQEYDFAQAYHEAEFSPATVKELVAEFQGDRSAKTDGSQQYIRNYFVGNLSLALKPFWPIYVCSLENDTAATFTACVCSTGK